MTNRTVALLGGGKMAEALLGGLIRSGGRTPDEIMVTCRRDERARELAGKYGITATLDNPEAARWAGTLVLMAKPQDLDVLLSQIRADVTPEDLVISFAAGIRTSFVEKRLPDGVPVVRVMSNVPVMVDEAMSVVAAGSLATDEHLGHGRGAARLRRQGAAAEGIASGRRHGDERQRARRTSSCSPRR